MTSCLVVISWTVTVYVPCICMLMLYLPEIKWLINWLIDWLMYWILHLSQLPVPHLVIANERLWSATTSDTHTQCRARLTNNVNHNASRRSNVIRIHITDGPWRSFIQLQIAYNTAKITHTCKQLTDRPVNKAVNRLHYQLISQICFMLCCWQVQVQDG